MKKLEFSLILQSQKYKIQQGMVENLISIFYLNIEFKYLIKEKREKKDNKSIDI